MLSKFLDCFSETIVNFGIHFTIYSSTVVQLLSFQYTLVVLKLAKIAPLLHRYSRVTVDCTA